MYREEMWTRDRTLDETIKCVEKSSLIFRCVQDDSLVAFARVLTEDYRVVFQGAATEIIAAVLFSIP